MDDDGKMSMTDVFSKALYQTAKSLGRIMSEKPIIFSTPMVKAMIEQKIEMEGL